jgi:hypothetical protein
MNPARLAVVQTLIVCTLMGTVIASLVTPGPQETENPVHHHAQPPEQC